MSDRDDFLGRIRGALGRTERLDAPLASPPTALGPEDELSVRVEQVQELIRRDADNLLDVLGRAAVLVGWNVERVRDVGDAGRYVLQVACDLEARSAVCSLHPVVRDAIGGGLFSGTGIDLTPISVDRTDDELELESRLGLRGVMERADLGITGVDYAIAETGTCVIIPRAGVSRLVSLLPPVHIALVERGQVLPSLDELFTLRRRDFVDGQLVSYMNLITGPSRTADIEYQLVTGVHGPGEVHMVLIG